MKQKNVAGRRSGRHLNRITSQSNKRSKGKRRVAKKQLQPPFREKDLLTIDAFIRHCEDYGIKTDRGELEYFEKETLLLPAVRVFSGVLEFGRVLADFDGKEEWRYIPKPEIGMVRSRYRVKRVEARAYYRPGVWGMGEGGWLKRFTKMGLVKYPAKQRKFRPWRYYELWEYHEREKNGYVTDWKILENAADALYSQLQMYILPWIQGRRGLVVKNDMLFAPSEDWLRMAETAKRVFDRDKTSESIRRMVVRHYRFFALLVDIEKLWDKYSMDLDQELRKDVKEQLEEGRQVTPKELIDEVMKVWRSQRTPLDEYLRDDAKALLKKHRFSRAEVEKWRFTFLGYGTLSLKRPLVKRYLLKVTEQDLIEAEHPYRIFAIVNWFIRLCGGKGVSIRQAIFGFSGKFCPYCQRPYLPRRKDQITCGSLNCVRARSNELKRIARMPHKYDF